MTNLFDAPPSSLPEEKFEAILKHDDLLIERIVSTSQATPPGEWLSQDRAEWVAVLRGRAGLRFEGEDGVREMTPGDHYLIPGGVRHRVEWTSRDEPTIWLAVHFSR